MLRRTLLMSLAGLAVTAPVLGACTSSGKSKSSGGTSGTNDKIIGSRPIQGELARTPDFETMLELIRTAGLSDMLDGAGPFTLLAVDDQGFARTYQPHQIIQLQRPNRRDDLVRLVKHHIIAGRLTERDLQQQRRIRTLAGSEVEARRRSSTLEIDGIPILRPNEAAANGIIHVLGMPLG